MSSVRKFHRIVLFVLLMLTGVILTIIFLRNSIPPRSFASTIVTSWLGFVARTFGIKIKTYGIALKAQTLFVSNHISWLDILILGNLVPIHFLSKHEVKNMPVIGWLATRAGTLYIKRGYKGSASDASSEITKVLKKHHNSLVFAEGTTSDGQVKKFHSRMMQSAIDAHSMVQPVAIFYPLVNPETGQTEINPVALFIGDTSIGESFDLITRSHSIDVEVHFLKPINSACKTRDEIAQYAYNEVVDAIELIKKKTP